MLFSSDRTPGAGNQNFMSSDRIPGAGNQNFMSSDRTPGAGNQNCEGGGPTGVGISRRGGEVFAAQEFGLVSQNPRGGNYAVTSERQKIEVSNQVDPARGCGEERNVLTSEQKRVVQLAEMGCNIFIGGAAGSGKTFLLRHLLTALRRMHGDDAVSATASTGYRAFLCCLSCIAKRHVAPWLKKHRNENALKSRVCCCELPLEKVSRAVL